MTVALTLGQFFLYWFACALPVAILVGKLIRGRNQ